MRDFPKIRGRRSFAKPIKALVTSSYIPRGVRILLLRAQKRLIDWRDVEIESETKFGGKMLLRLSDKLEMRIFMFGVWEPPLTEYIRNSLRDGDIFVDVGANIGYYSIIADQLVGGNGKVYAIEASPSISSALRRNISISNAKAVTVIEGAISNRNGKVRFYLNHENNRGGSTIVEQVASLHDSEFESEVECTTLDQVIPRDDIIRARMIKIDVEGAEYDVIDGIKDMITSFSDKTEIVMEVTPSALTQQGHSVDDLLGPFLEAGFHAFAIDNSYEHEFYFRDTYRPPERIRSWPRDQFDVLLRKGS